MTSYYRRDQISTSIAHDFRNASEASYIASLEVHDTLKHVNKILLGRLFGLVIARGVGGDLSSTDAVMWYSAKSRIAADKL